MNLDEIAQCIMREFKSFNNKIKNKEFIKFIDSIVNLTLLSDEINYNFEFSIYTLNLLNCQDLPFEIKKNLRHEIDERFDLKNSKKNKKLIRTSKLKERRAFVNFLELWQPNLWQNVYFQDRERPDFSVKLNNKLIGIELTEAITRQNATHDTFCQQTIGSNKTLAERKDIITNKFTSFNNKFYIREINSIIVSSSQQGLSNTSELRDCISVRVKDKIVKFLNYKDAFDLRYIDVYLDGIGFSNQSDFKIVEEQLIKELNSIDKNTDKIFISNGLDKLLVEYDKNGFLKSVKL